jgi:hypothetical protein
MNKRIALAALAVSFASWAFAQGQKPQPRGAATATIGGKKVAIDYGRPALKGRNMGELLKQLPPDRIWRAGENDVTTLSSEADLTIGGKKVAAGKYSVYVHAPEAGDWSLILNSDPGIALIKLWDKAPASEANKPWPRLDGYDKVKDKEILRAAMKASAAPAPVEVFTMNLAPAAGGATLSLAWGDKSWSLDVKAAK